MLIMCIALCVGIMFFVGVHWGFDLFITKKYMAPSAIAARNVKYLESLQEYVLENDISSKDTASIKRWVKSQKYVYLFLYKDNELLFEGGVDDESGSSITIGSPNDEDISRKEMMPIRLSDGVILASVSESTGHVFYNISYIVSILAAFIVFAVIMLTYFSRMMMRIQRLARCVRLIEHDKDASDIKDDVGDEISGLADDVNKMRASILEKVEEERNAWQANAQLITAMSHDIRNPLTVLIGYLDIIGLQNDISKQSMGYVSACKDTAMKIKSLSDDMFQYFLVFGKKNVDMSLQEYDMLDLLTEMLYEHIILMSENGYEFIVNKVDKACNAVIDATVFARVIDNVFSNIEKYADSTKPIYINMGFDDGKLRIRFENTIAHKDTESNGIGLKTCVKIMETLGGEFTIQNDEEHNKFTSVISVLLKDK